MFSQRNGGEKVEAGGSRAVASGDETFFRIVAPSRLHFGLLSFGNPVRRQFGGVGVMVDRPGVTLTLTASRAFSTAGSLAHRIAEFAHRWRRFYGLSHLPCCRIRVSQAPEQHIGLGVGTQLAMSVAAGLNEWTEQPTVEAHELAESVGRTSRSSIGSHGFVRGGLLFELGKYSSEPLARLEDRVALPSHWRVVLICPAHRVGLSGTFEAQAFQRLPPVSSATTDRLIEEVDSVMLPAAKSGCLPEFGESVYRYGVSAGECFASLQGGPFADKLLDTWVRAIRRRGVAGVGQSSWGPSLFVFQPNQQAAQEFVDWFRRDQLTSDLDVRFFISGVNNCGATVDTSTKSHPSG